MRRIANIAAFCVTALACYGMQISKPHYADLTGPIPAYGSMDDTVETRLFDVHVDRVVFAQSLKVNEFGKEKVLTTGGLWAVVATGLAARDQSTMIGSATWQGPTGLRYRQSERISFAPGLPPHMVDPGLPKKGRFIFEIPPERRTVRRCWSPTRCISRWTRRRGSRSTRSSLRRMGHPKASSPSTISTNRFRAT